MKAIRVLLVSGEEKVHISRDLMSVAYMYRENIRSLEVMEGEVIVGTGQSMYSTPEGLISHTCLRLGVTRQDIFSHDKSNRRFLEIRKVLSYLLRDEFNLSYTDIGNCVNKCHRSIIDYIRNAGEAISKKEGEMYRYYVLIRGEENVSR